MIDYSTSRAPLQRRRAAAALAAGCALTIAGCTPALPDPVVSAVAPGWGFNGDDTYVELVGAGFYPSVQVDRSERSTIDDGFTVHLQTDPVTELEDVAIVDYQHLGATVPAGAPVGTYDVTLIGPTGASTTLAEGFEVRDSRADQLVVSTEGDQIEWQVYDYAAINVELVDPDGNRVPEELVIQATVDDSLADSVIFQDDTLDGQEALADGTGIRGRLGADGAGVVGVTSTRLNDSLLVRFDVVSDRQTVAGADQFLSFVAGEPTSVEVSLPSALFTATAGQAFDIDLQVVDDVGAAVDDAQAELAIIERCAGGSLRETVSFVGALSGHSVTLTRATGDSCTSNGVDVFGFVNGVEVEGSSDALDVDPADPVGLVIEVWPPEVVAGVDSVYADVRVVDEFGNRVLDQTGSLELQVTVDGSAPFAPADQSCEDIVDGQTFCTVRIDTAGDQVVLLGTTTGPESLSGASEPFTVLAGEAVSLEASVATDPVVAGESFELRLRAVDSLGNGVVLDPEGADAAAISDADGATSCAWSYAEDPRGTLVYACSTTLAVPLRQLDVDLSSRGLHATTNGFQVVNGDLAAVSFDLAGVDEVTAGQSLTVELTGTDAFGNPYVVQGDPVVLLDDLAGPVVPSSATLDASGAAQLDVTVTVARTADRLVASQSDHDLGSSTEFDVLPAAATQLALTLARTWAWLDEDLPVQVEALDPYNNRSVDYSGPVTLSSAGGLGDDVVVDSFSGGVADAGFIFHSIGLADVLSVDDGTLTDSAEVDALDPDCPDPPVAALTIGGDDVAVLCLLDSTGRTAGTAVSGSGSVEGAVPIVAWHFEDTDGTWTRLGTATRYRSWDEAGGWTLAMTVADRDACGSTTSATLYVAPDDGSPAGPVEIFVDDALLGTSYAATSLPESTTVTLQASDCTGDPASADALLLRPDLGEIEVDGSSVVATGEGIEAGLSGLGTASVTWSAADWPHSGVATLHVGHRTGQAYGSATAEIDGDLTLPTVVDVDPRGSLSSSFDSVTVTFSEPLYASSIQPAAVELLGALGTPLTLSEGDLLLSTDATSLTLMLPEIIDPTTDVLGLTLLSERSAGVRDVEGNLLDGTWTGARSAFVLDVGAVADTAPDLSSCSADPTLFRPDGDDGTGSEADQVDVSVSADDVPAWWRLVVSVAGGDQVRTLWVPESSSSSAVIAWDGRGDDGRVLDNGTYSLTLAAADEHWNLGAPCTLQVGLANRGTSP